MRVWLTILVACLSIPSPAMAYDTERFEILGTKVTTFRHGLIRNHKRTFPTDTSIALSSEQVKSLSGLSSETPNLVSKPYADGGLRKNLRGWESKQKNFGWNLDDRCSALTNLKLPVSIGRVEGPIDLHIFNLRPRTDAPKVLTLEEYLRGDSGVFYGIEMRTTRHQKGFPSSK